MEHSCFVGRDLKEKIEKIYIDQTWDSKIPSCQVTITRINNLDCTLRYLMASHNEWARFPAAVAWDVPVKFQGPGLSSLCLFSIPRQNCDFIAVFFEAEGREVLR